ncbi:hypothetical protein XU18_1298 [Perkinsela sp. CCAP 1560/4]|nr:hypothetical protein XU18_1298 [Perkinsela sp. CCAP 1560/4]|eukprot:KNH08132.1 hypothetical protein XU18_1298 [Perkinsela sp. CCAP 1560/4]
MLHRATLTFVRGQSPPTQRPLDLAGVLKRLPSCTSTAEVVDNLKRYTAHCAENKSPAALGPHARTSLFRGIPDKTLHDAIYAYCISARIIPDLHDLNTDVHEKKFGSQTYSELIRTQTTTSVILEYWAKLLRANGPVSEETHKLPRELEAAALYALAHCIAEKKFTDAVRVFDDIHGHVKNRLYCDPFTNKAQLERHLVELLLGLMESGEKYSTVRRVTDAFYFPLCDALMATSDRPIVESTLTTVLLYLAGYGHNFQQIEGIWEAARLETHIDRSTLCVAMCRACELLRFDGMKASDFTRLLRVIEEVYNYQMQSVTFDVHHERAIIAVVELLELLVGDCFRDCTSTLGRLNGLAPVSSSGAANPIVVGRCLSFAAQIFLRHEFTTLFQRPYYSSMLKVLTTDPKRSANWTKVILLEMSRQGYRYLTFDERSTLVTSTLLAFTWNVQSLFQTEADDVSRFWDLFKMRSAGGDEWTIYSADHFDALLFDGAVVSGLSGGRIREKPTSVDEVYRPAHGVARNDARLSGLLVRFWLRAAILLAVVTCVEKASKSPGATDCRLWRSSEKCLRLLRAEINKQYPYISSTILRHAGADSTPISAKTFEARRQQLVRENVVIELASTLAARPTGHILTASAVRSTGFDCIPITEEIVWCYRWVLSRFASHATGANDAEVSEDFHRVRIFQYYRVACALESQWGAATLTAYARSLHGPSSAVVL